MKKLVNDILNKLNLPYIQFADVRYTSIDEEGFYFENGSLKEYSSELDHNSIGIRVLIDGCWGFAGTNSITSKEIERIIKRAISNAKHGANFMKKPVEFPSMKPTNASYIHKPEVDPFLMEKSEKLDFLYNIAKKLNGHEKIVHNYLYSIFYRQYKVYANSEGTFADSLQYHTLPTYFVLSSNGEEVMSRTFPGHMAAQKGGFEVIKNYQLEENIDNTIKEAVDLLTAPRIEEEKADIIIAGGHLALQLHESIGHATEADRIFGKEISYAGKTFITPEMIGGFKYGSEHVNIISDSTDPEGMGYHPVDDEGVPAKRVDIIKDGILKDQQTSREIAHLLGLEPSSNMKATDGYEYPLIRMTNISLLPGKAGSLEDLIKDTEKGYLVDFTKTWSIDDNRNNFQFTTEIGWKIENGEIKGIVKEPTYFGITPEFWGSCDAVCGESEWKYHGTFHCGKGEPGQAMHLSHKVAPARFKNVVCNVKA